MKKYNIESILKSLGIEPVNYGATSGSSAGWIETGGEELISYSPIDGEPIAKIVQARREDYETILKRARIAFTKFRMMPAPRRGEIIREIGDTLLKKKQDLASLITIETGKIRPEGEGEVQEMIDIAHFAVGLSRQLYGSTMHSERPFHRMYEQWHPLGIVGIITAFNFPVAVWSWNALVAAVCGDVNLFKPSSKAPLTAIAIQKTIAPVVDKYDIDGVFNLVIGDRTEIGDTMLKDPRIPLISATGSVAMGKKVATEVGGRLGRTLLELGGNNAVIVTEESDLDLAAKAVLFGAVGTAGQRCTSTRRLIVHHSVKESFVKKLVSMYRRLPIGDPMEPETLMGPLIDKKAKENMNAAIEAAVDQGGEIIYGGTSLTIKGLENGFYVTPALVEARNDLQIVQQETFAPILYVITYNTFDEAIEIHNNVPQGLSSSLFTNSVKYQERFLSHAGSDCGIANVNIATSGAEIGGAFGGEKETGGGREAGSDAWKAYMRRQTNTINWGDDMPLAQGIVFGGKKEE